MKLLGTCASEGIVYGRTYFLHRYNTVVSPIIIEDTTHELHLLDEAILSVEKDLLEIIKQVKNSVGEDKALIFEAHIHILKDSELYRLAKRIIEVNKLSASFAFDTAIETYASSFEYMENPYMKERAVDLRDISKRVVSYLENDFINAITFDENVILIVNELLPSDITLFTNKHVLGFISLKGGLTAHSSILARSLGIPFVFGVENAFLEIENDKMVIFNSKNLELTCNPTQKELNDYKKMVQELETKSNKKIKNIKSETIDGFKIDVNVNINYEFEIDNLKYDSDFGIGLFRTEFLFMNRIDLPSFEEQVIVYQNILKAINNNKVVIRTLDIGGDKELSSPYKSFELNPSLGCKSIRYCLNNPDIFKRQLRALLVASICGDLHVLLPMISTYEEFLEAHKILKGVERDLTNEGIIFNYKLGIMIEVPSSIYIIKHLAEYVDFFSVGSNDLIQYFFAADRSNDAIAHLYQPNNPVFIKVLDEIVKEVHKYNKPISICGEMGSNSSSIPLLTGIGFDEISVVPNVRLDIKKLIAKSNKEDLRNLVDKAVELKTEKEVIELTKKYIY
ncbi:MAG: phosphoenolpyruvate--protein phosphotransferase [Candidatus Izemoplasma sp.]